ncbi:hypothetical protein ACWESE_31405, partial [Streptomyces xanthochromogenes]
WLATSGTAWLARRSTDLLPQLLRLAGDELRHAARGTAVRLDLHAADALAAALATVAPVPDQRQCVRTNLSGVPGTACAAAARSGSGTTPITG